MSMVCQQCQQPVDPQIQTCACRSPFQLSNLENTPVPTGDPAAPVQYTPWSKIVVGVLLAVGLSYGLRQLFTAGLTVGSDSAATGLWTTLAGLVLLHLLESVSLLVGGAVTGAGQPRGLLYGSVVGLVSGGAFLAMQRHQGDDQPGLLLFVQPILHALVGMLGGMLGMLIWKPPPAIPLATGVAASPPERRAASQLFSGPIHYGRVFTGAFVVVVGVVWANGILEYVLRASNGTLAVSSHMQARLIGWEIAALATLLGAGLAGATTRNGLKQGLCVGLGAAVVIIGVHVGNGKLLLESLIASLTSVFGLSLAGGWFGGQLFPPLVARRRRSLSSLD
jgi:hypothetical protein